MRLILYKPEIAANVGAAIRNCACFGANLSVIEPCGFPWKAKDINRVALDYGEHVLPTRHSSWENYLQSEERAAGRLILLTTKSDIALPSLELRETDLFMLGQESAGVPAEVAAACDHAVTIPLAPAARSLNMATTGAIALAEARRQIGF